MSNFKPIGRRRKFIREEKPEKLLKQMANDHLDVLQNIEFSIVSSYRQNNRIDDKVVAAALKAALRGDEATDEMSYSIVEALEEMRLFREDVSDEIWEKGLKVVLESVYNHSEARSGDRYYLEFISEFVH